MSSLSATSKSNTRPRNLPGSKSRSTFPNTFKFHNTPNDRYLYTILKQRLNNKNPTSLHLFKNDMKLITPEKKKKETRKQLKDDLLKARRDKIKLNLLESRLPKSAIKNIDYE